MNETIIISYRQIDDFRKKNIDLVLKYLSICLPKAEIVVVEQDSTIKFDNKYGVKHIFIEDGGEFNKSRCYNTGVKASSNENLLFHDINCILPIENYLLHAKEIDKYDVIDPYSHIFFLDKFYTDWFCKLKLEFGMLKKFNIKPVQSYVISGGVFWCKKTYFNSLKGFDERFIGYGHEDDAFDIKMSLMGVKIKKYKDWCVHLYHPKSSNANNNAKLFEMYKKFNRKDIEKLIISNQ